MVSKTHIERRLRKKTNPELVEAVIQLKRTNPVIAKEIVKPSRDRKEINLDKLNLPKGDVLIAGKVLSSGNLDSAKKVVAWSASEKAIEKIKKAGGSFVRIAEEIKKNPELKNLEVVE